MTASISFQGFAIQAGGSSSRTLSFTVASAAGQERLVLLCAITSNYSGTTFGNVTVDGQTATQVGSYVRAYDGTSSNGPIISFWRAAGTSATSVAVNFDITAGAVFDARGVLWSLNDAGTLFDTGSQANTFPVVSDLSVDLDTTTGGVVAAAFLAYNSSIKTASWTGLTERYDGGADSLYGVDWFGAADLNVSSGSTPLAVIIDLPSDRTGNGAQVGLAASFNPAAGAGTTLTAAAGSYAVTGSAVTEHLVMPLGAAGE